MGGHLLCCTVQFMISLCFIFLSFCILVSIGHTFIRVPPSPGYHLARGIHIGENPARKFIRSLNLPGWPCPTKRHKTGLKRGIQKEITFTAQHVCRKLGVLKCWAFKQNEISILRKKFDPGECVYFWRKSSRGHNFTELAGCEGETGDYSINFPTQSSIWTSADKNAKIISLVPKYPIWSGVKENSIYRYSSVERA